ncbi:MAG: hypothetical protein WC198_09895 [Victivallaceae bacterium]
MNRKNYERGQAMVEMCAGLIGILVMIVAVILISGISVTNIKMLQESKRNAEINALKSEVDELTVRADINYWYYGDNRMPFDGNDRAVFLSNDEAGVITEALQSGDYSEANAADRPYDYAFTPLNQVELRTGARAENTNLINSNFFSYATAANLVNGSFETDNSLYSYRSMSSRDRRAFYNAAAHWLGINPQTMLNQWQNANLAWMPKNADGEATGINP